MTKRLLPVLLLLATPVAADVPPLPGTYERYLAELIRQAGYQCTDQPSIRQATPQEQKDFQAQGLKVSRVVCGDNRTYLVGTPPRAQPNGPWPPEPVVQKLD